MTLKERNEKYIREENRKAFLRKIEFYKNFIEECRAKTVPSKDKYLKRCATKSRYLTYVIPSTDFYYVQLINDTLKQIRKGRIAFIYTEEQIKDILRFEPTAKIWYMPQGRYFSVALPDKEVN